MTTADLEEALIRAAREGARQALETSPEPSPWLSVASAATYLDTSEEAVRSAEKRGQLRGHRSATGRVMFRREDLDAFAVGGKN